VPAVSTLVIENATTASLHAIALRFIVPLLSMLAFLPLSQLLVLWPNRGYFAGRVGGKRKYVSTNGNLRFGGRRTVDQMFSMGLLCTFAGPARCGICQGRSFADDESARIRLVCCSVRNSPFAREGTQVPLKYWAGVGPFQLSQLTVRPFVLMTDDTDWNDFGAHFKIVNLGEWEGSAGRPARRAGTITHEFARDLR
jgi:hypothetical protein